MPWLRIDDSFYDHPKVVEAGPLCLALHICALGYAARHLTDGHIPRAMVWTLARFTGIGLFDGRRQRGPTMEVNVMDLAERLVEVGLWEHCGQVGDGYMIHDFLDYNPSRKEVEEERRSNADRQARWRKTHRKTDGSFESNGPRNALLTPPRTRPVPSISKEIEVRDRGNVDKPAMRHVGDAARSTERGLSK